jgi:RND family efflux transporter MFP subunit
MRRASTAAELVEPDEAPDRIPVEVHTSRLDRVRALRLPQGARGLPIEVSRGSSPRLVAGAAAGIIALVAVLYLGSSQFTGSSGAAQAASVPVLPAAAGTPSKFEAAGFVVARRQATVAAEVTGRVIALPVEEGQRVHRGMILARLDSKAAETEVATAEAEEGTARAAISATQAQLADARKSYARSQSLLRSGFVTASRASADEAAMRTLEAQLAKTHAELTAQQLRIRRARQELSKFTITAPFDGVIVGRNAQVGEMISPISAGGGFTRTGICTIVDMGSLEIAVDVSEQNIGQVAVGDLATATVDAYKNIAIPARVTAIIPAANREKGTVTVRLRPIRPDSRVLPNMSSKVIFTGRQV